MMAFLLSRDEFCNKLNSLNLSFLKKYTVSENQEWELSNKNFIFH